TTYRKRRQQRAILEDRVDDYRSESIERHVDMGVVLRVVVPDDAGKLLVGDRPLRVVREHAFGGLVDTTPGRAAIIGPSPSPEVWHCSTDQEKILLHDEAARPAQLVYGSEGSGKTRALAMWHFLCGVLPHIGEGRQGGQTAPTEDRLESMLAEMRALYPGRW